MHQPLGPLLHVRQLPLNPVQNRAGFRLQLVGRRAGGQGRLQLFYGRDYNGSPPLGGDRGLAHFHFGRLGGGLLAGFALGVSACGHAGNLGRRAPEAKMERGVTGGFRPVRPNPDGDGKTRSDQACQVQPVPRALFRRMCWIIGWLLAVGALAYWFVYASNPVALLCACGLAGLLYVLRKSARLVG